MAKKKEQQQHSKEEEEDDEIEKPAKRKGKHDKPKPWDDESVDHWKVDKFDPSWNPTGMLATSEFRVLFPQYRENYLREAWPNVKNVLKEHGIACELNLVEGYMWVATTLKTRDPYIIIKARDLLTLLARSVPAPQAVKVLDDQVQCDIIKIGNLVRNKERFVKRRQHLVGPNSSTLKALEILTECYILVQGNTVAAMGSFKGLKQIRRVVEDCILNKKHPVHHIKDLMVRRELEKNPEMATVSWDHLRPNFKKKNVQQKKVKSKEKKPYTAFPPPQPPSKVDLQLESGEYFLNDQKKFSKKWLEKQEKQSAKTAENKRKREEAFIAPEEPKSINPKSQKDEKTDVAAMAQSLKKKSKGLKMQKTAGNIDPENYIAKTKKAKHA